MNDQPPLDLSPARGEALVEAALVRQHLARLTEAAAVRPAQEVLLQELARLAARVEAMEERQAAERRSREELLRIDPLPFIPLARQQSVVAPTPPLVMLHEQDVADPDFQGAGWWGVERLGDGPLRWSGAARAATVLLPGLGGGTLEVTLRLRAPFGQQIEIAEHSAFVDGVPVALEGLEVGRGAGTFRGRATLPDMPPGARVTLLLTGPRGEDPSSAPSRVKRRLGLGLYWVRIERAG